jgi:hypothetical protein
MLSSDGQGQRADALIAAFEEAAITPERVGAFRFYFDDQRWEWSGPRSQVVDELPTVDNPGVGASL